MNLPGPGSNSDHSEIQKNEVLHLNRVGCVWLTPSLKMGVAYDQPPPSDRTPSADREPMVRGEVENLGWNLQTMTHLAHNTMWGTEINGQCDRQTLRSDWSEFEISHCERAVQTDRWNL